MTRSSALKETFQEPAVGLEEPPKIILAICEHFGQMNGLLKLIANSGALGKDDEVYRLKRDRMRPIWKRSKNTVFLPSQFVLLIFVLQWHPYDGSIM